MILLSLLATLTMGQVATTQDCRQPDAAMLALPLEEFDQTPAGWRSLDAEGCEAVGADAIALMLEGRDQESDAIQPYVDASVAFLRQDREALLAARARLVALPVPEYFARAAERYRANYPDLPPLSWPLNLNKVDGFIACFDRPYREAYSCDAEGNVE